MKAEKFSRAPYPGLRSFRREETDLFFGREDCVGSMVDRLRDTHFLAVLGSSGTGKSSVVKTGLLDALEVGLMAGAGSNWRVVDFRPGGAPLNNLARRLLETDEQAAEVGNADVALLRGFLARGPRAIIEWCRDGHLSDGQNLLLLVDQFEELFRYQDYAGREEAEALVALLLECAHSPQFPIYVTITMRSEYLGACTLIQGLAEAISAGMVLTPRMTREQCRAAIERPAAVCKIEIESPLVNRLLTDLANFAPWDDGDNNDQLDRLVRRADQLPLLQYTLNRMWLQARERWIKGGRVDSGALKLRLSEYEGIGGLGGALNGHADQILKGLADRGLEPTVELVFRALISGTTVADAVRRPTRFGELVALAGGNREAVRTVVDAFREPGCNFLLPELDPKNPKDLSDETFIDISHESLIRQWKKLSDWLAKESSASQNWRRLRDNVAAGYLVRGKELSDLVSWRNESKPTEQWAKRYGGDFAAAIAFLNASERTEAAERRRSLLVRRVVAGVAVIAILVTGGLYFGEEYRMRLQKIEMEQEQRANITEDTGAKKGKDTANSGESLDVTAQLIANLKDENEMLKSELAALPGSATALDALREALDQNRLLVQSNNQLKTEDEKLKTQAAQLRSDNASLKAQLEAALKAPGSSQQPQQQAAGLGPVPAKDDYAGETTDFKVDPQETLQKNIDSPTPTTLPDGQVLTTKQVYEAMATGKLKGKSFLIIDVWDDTQHPTIPSALRLPYAGSAGEFTDDIQQKMFDDMTKLIKDGVWTVPVIFFTKGVKNWEAYNASLRAIEMGNTLVYWYRGGLASWQDAGQPVAAGQPVEKPTDPLKGNQ